MSQSVTGVDEDINPTSQIPIGHTSADEDLLASLGYKQVLKRSYGIIEIYGIALSIMSLMPSLASTLPFSLPSGPAGMTWSWICASCLIGTVGVTMAELGSSLPCAGALYWWTHHFAPERLRRSLCFLTAYANTLGYIGGLCGIDYGFALIIKSCISISTHGHLQPSNIIVYCIFFACVVSHVAFVSLFSPFMNKLQKLNISANVLIIIATIVALLVGRATVAYNSASFIFTRIDNSTSWPTGWTFMLAWLSPIWTIQAFDSCVHMSEEAVNASKAVPLGILMAIGSCGVLGWVCLVVITATMDSNFETTLTSPFGPMGQIYYDAVGRGAILLMALLAVVQWLMGVSVIVAGSRLVWAFSRDGGLPLSRHLSVVNQTVMAPLRAVWFCGVVAAVLGLLCILTESVAEALFSVAVASNLLAWAIPILCRLTNRQKFKRGWFYTGVLSTPISIVALTFIAFGILLCQFPFNGPNPRPGEANYTPAINGCVWGGCLLYYFTCAHKWFEGPKTTIQITE